LVRATKRRKKANSKIELLLYKNAPARESERMPSSNIIANRTRKLRAVTPVDEVENTIHKPAKLLKLSNILRNRAAIRPVVNTRKRRKIDATLVHKRWVPFKLT
jgi:hypothetical protein